ncbi:O-antigen ligase family protein [Owenweeksia hongkongensis]|uniref:O-antigen ligase family protein n=1 Tax=Owenweeksia hongkongensis TaxID=253245 RepID=UPI003A8D83CB
MKLSIENLFKFLFPLLVCSLYLPPVFYALLTASLVILAGLALGKGYRFNYKQPLPWLFVGFYLAHLNGLIINTNHDAVWSGVQNKLSFILLPFVLMVFHPLLTRSFFRKLIAAFFYSSVLICLVFLILSTINLFENYNQLAEHNRIEELRAFNHYYASFLTHGYMHRSYFGLLIGAALFSSPFVAPIHSTKRFFFYLGIVLLLGVLFLLQSRMILIAFVFCAFLYLVLKIIQSRSITWAVYLGLGIISLGVLAFFFKDSPYNRFNKVAVEDYELSGDSNDFTGSTIRFAIWENSLELIKEHPVVGVGYGDLRKKRLEVYRENGFKIGHSQKFNSHNQLLETQLVAGIPGTFFLLAMFGVVVWIAIKRKDTHLFILTTFIFLSMLTEAMFERQLAITFWCTYILALAMGEKVAFKKEEPALSKLS